MDFKKLFRKGTKSRGRPKRPEYQDRNHHPCLPQPRKRALTLQEHNQQTSSRLLSLPFDLRCRIYGAVLGHYKVHLAFEFGPREYRTGKKKEHLEWRWWHCICTWDQTEDDRYWNPGNDCCRWCKVNGDPGPPNGMMGKLKLDFAILLTCRKVYSEAIDILYRTTTFNFDSRQLLCDFSTLVLPHRFALITSIEMTWGFINLGVSVILAEDKQLYHDMWTALSRMPNLRRIKIAIAAYECPSPVPDDLQEVWLGPLAQIGPMDLFEVLVPETYARHFRVDQGSNFTLSTFRGPAIVVMSCFGSSSIME